MKFLIYQDRAKEWRWRLKARNGRIVADSGEGYSTKYNAKHAARNVAADLAYCSQDYEYLKGKL